jgi:D-beta-D-heptose 7-phosphate kinase / D-beta-D-heptose 1-phosphate adenosyltransferase
MSNYFSPSSTARVLVVGDVILDRYVYGDTNRISPEAPVPVVKVYKTEERPGGAANVAMNIRTLGVAVQLIGITGDDNSADILSAQLGKIGVECNFIQRQGFSTVTKLRVLSQHQQLLRLDYESDTDITSAELLHDLYKNALGQSDVVVLSDYAKGSLSHVEDFIKLAKAQGVPVLVDPKGSDFNRYSGASFLTPNLKEFESIVGICKSDHELEKKADELCRSLNLDALLVTRGERGMSMIDNTSDNVIHLDARAHEVFDVTGAGDTVIGVLAAALASGYKSEQAVNFANFAAGLVVEKLGTASVSATELNAAIGGGNKTTNGIIQRQDLVNIIEAAKSRNERIVMTNGCFDIIHAGHVEYLKTAGTLGDRLLIVVNDDESVFRLKGKNRPINSLKNRMSVLEGLSSSDWISSFSEDTPGEIISLVKPDVLVKGADYLPEEIVGADFVRSYGGEVVTIPFESQCSTSDVINKIQKGNVEESK